jgi:2-dehydro-3-deoxyphosphogluconate aldolase / (4S)-4-hydroxy-2-oxoglutarate aldolase
MNAPALRQLLDSRRILVATSVETAMHAVPLARACLAGGLDSLEITFRNSHAAEAIRRIRGEIPEVSVGAGTLLGPRDISEAIAAGAQFGLTPGFNPSVVREARQRGLTLIPGVATPGEMEQALELGCELVKVFPAESLGGVDYLAAVFKPYAHTPLRFIPLGGVNESNLARYLSTPGVLAVGGSWMTPAAAMRGLDWTSITCAVARALEIVMRSR